MLLCCKFVAVSIGCYSILLITTYVSDRLQGSLVSCYCRFSEEISDTIYVFPVLPLGSPLRPPQLSVIRGAGFLVLSPITALFTSVEQIRRLGSELLKSLVPPSRVPFRSLECSFLDRHLTFLAAQTLSDARIYPSPLDRSYVVCEPPIKNRTAAFRMLKLHLDALDLSILYA